MKVTRTPMLLRALVPGLLVVGIAVKSLAPVSDPDTWWHIRSGAELADTWVFSGPDPWGTFATNQWVRHQWLPDLTFHAADRIGGLPAVAWLLPLMAVATTIALYATSRQRAGILASGVTTAIALLAMSGSLSLRPQVVSFTFASIIAGAWLAMGRDRRPRLWLIPLTWIWACCHGFWLLSPLLGLLVVAALLIRPGGTPRPWALAALPVACLAIGLATPVGPRLLLAPLQVSGVTAYLEEWQRSPLLDPAFLAGLAMVATVLATWAIRRTTADPASVVLVTVGLLLVLESRRTVGLGAALVAPVLAESLQHLVGRGPEARAPRAWLGLLTAATVGLGGAAVLAPSVAARPNGVPDGLSGRLAALAPHTVVCNAYDAGSWLLFAHPALRPVIDGRTEIYSPDQVRAFVAFASGGSSSSAYADAMGCRAALLRTDSPAASALVASGTWRRSGEAGGWLVLERTA